MPVYPVGCEVLVRSEKYHNFSGIVTKINRTDLARPIVILFKDEKNTPVEPVEIDMREETDFYVRAKIPG